VSAISDKRINLGGDSDSTTYTWKGILQDMAIWDEMLSGSEMVALHFGKNPLTVRPGSLRAYWPLDGYDSPARDLGPYNYSAIRVIGTKLQAGSRFRNSYRQPNLVDMPTLFATGVAPPSFISGWSRQSNLPVIGGGTY
jgi:hypothetical protein